MNGQKPLFTFLVIIIFIFTFSYFKNVIKRDKQLKLQREHETKMELEQKKMKAVLKKQKEEFEKHQRLLDKMKEYKNICHSIHALILRPEKEIIIDTDSPKSKANQIEEVVKKPKSSDMKSQKEITSEIKSQNNVVSESIIYLFLLVLIYSLFKAATDISQHFNKKKEEEVERADRRRSLQGYAISAKSEMKNPKVPLVRRSTVLTMDVHHPKPFNKLFEERRLSRVIPEAEYSGQITEPGTPTKISNGLAIKPPPLLRRCSVPAFVLQNTGHPNMLRRPSIDSFSEDDSSPDVKRRVRMIHRH